MRRVVSLLAFCGMVLSTSYVLNVEAATSRSQVKKKVKQNSKAEKAKKKVIKKTQAKRKKQSNKKSKKKSKTVAISTKSKDDLVVLNEPIIDGSKLNESSIVVDKDIKLASDDEKFADKGIELASNDEKAVATNVIAKSEETILDQIDTPKKAKLVAQLDNSENIFKEKLQQVNNNRKLYDLIRTPKKEIKDNIQVTKFREELEHYRRVYSSKLKKA